MMVIYKPLYLLGKWSGSRVRMGEVRRVFFEK